MMRAHLDEARDHGDVMAALWASESSIYERFGFGSAASRVDAKLERGRAHFRGISSWRRHRASGGTGRGEAVAPDRISNRLATYGLE